MENLTEFDKIINAGKDNILKGRSFGAIEGQSFVYYGTEGQAAKVAQPQEMPEQEVLQEAVEVARPMPSANVFEVLEHTPRRMRNNGILKAAAYAIGIALIFFGLFAVTKVSGQLNEIQVENYKLKYSLSTLETEEKKLAYQVSTQMSEVEIADYARNQLGMVPADEVEKQVVNFSAGESFIIEDSGLSSEKSVFSAAIDYVKNIISGVMDYMN